MKRDRRIIVLGLVIALFGVLTVRPAAAADQRSDLFDHGDRWTGCSVTYSGPASMLRSTALRRP